MIENIRFNSVLSFDENVKEEFISEIWGGAIDRWRGNITPDIEARIEMKIATFSISCGGWFMTADTILCLIVLLPTHRRSGKKDAPHGQNFWRIYSALMAKAIEKGLYNDNYINKIIEQEDE